MWVTISIIFIYLLGVDDGVDDSQRALQFCHELGCATGNMKILFLMAHAFGSVHRCVGIE